MAENCYFPLIKTSISEVAIANLGAFQIVVPTTCRRGTGSPDSSSFVTAKREYSTNGWLVCRDRCVGRLKHLQIGKIAHGVSPFEPIQRLGPAVPLSFEVWSRRSLPPTVRASAILSCEFRNDPYPYCSLFRRCLPQFVRVYAIEGSPRREGLLKARQLLIDEAQFVAENRDHLKNVPFYREKFNF